MFKVINLFMKNAIKLWTTQKVIILDLPTRLYRGLIYPAFCLLTTMIQHELPHVNQTYEFFTTL